MTNFLTLSEDNHLFHFAPLQPFPITNIKLKFYSCNDTINDITYCGFGKRCEQSFPREKMDLFLEEKEMFQNRYRWRREHSAGSLHFASAVSGFDQE